MNTLTTGGETIFENLITYFVQPLYQLGAVLAFAYFLYGALMFILAARAGESEDMEKGKRHLIYGLLGLFIIFSINGILVLLNKSIGGFFGY